uniref:KIB1-4 beta-propeller domain-containing protein n=2 Tax=Aegilops tauschii subsp. strangulata TaxID=200361 RepID=A0A453AJZ2_AEGTS
GVACLVRAPRGAPGARHRRPPVPQRPRSLPGGVPLVALGAAPPRPPGTAAGRPTRRHLHDSVRRPLYPLPSFPDNTICIGSTDDWIALRHHDHPDGRNFLLHNPFTNTSVPLELDTVIAKATKVRKVLVRSTAAGDLIVAVLTNNTRRPFVLSRGGKDVWLPGSWDLLYNFIVDIAFVGDKLYAITQDENLFPIDIGMDGDGKLMVADGRRVVRQPRSHYGYNAWSESESEFEEEEEEAARASDEEATATFNVGVAGTSDEEAVGAPKEKTVGAFDEYDGETLDEEASGTSDKDATVPLDEFDDKEVVETSDEEATKTSNADEKVVGGTSNVELTWPLYDDLDKEWDTTSSETVNVAYEEEDEEDIEPWVRDENSLNDGFDYVYDDAPSKALTSIFRYLVESRGKLLMVKHYMQLTAPNGLPTRFTCQVEVFEASAGAWVPMTDVLGDQALFVSMRFSKSVPASCGDVEKDSIYFVNTGEVFNMRSNTCSPVRWQASITFETWVFPPKLVV